MNEIKNKEEWIHCNECGRSTSHIMVSSYRNGEYEEEMKDNNGMTFCVVDGYYEWELFECQGCKTVFLKKRQYFSEWGGHPDDDPCVYTFFPARNIAARSKPHWFDKFLNLDGVQGHFILISYKQIYELIESEKFLAAMLTARALLETLAVVHGDGDKRTFNDKLKALVEKEFIRKKQIDFLEKVIFDAGSASMHRGYNPSAEAVTHVLDSIEHLIHTIYIEPLADEYLKAEKPIRGSK